MKRLTLIFTAILLMATTANAQFFRWGIKGGVASSKFSIDETTLSNIQTTDGAKNFIIEQGESKLGIHFGLVARIQLLGLFIQPELLFNQTNGEFVFTEQDPNNLSNVTETITSQKFNKFDVPVIVGWKFGPARIGVGPVASFTLSEKDGLKDKMSDLVGENTSVESAISKAVFGYQAGVGLDLGKIATIDLKYEGNLSKLGESINIGDKDYNFDQRNPLLILSVGIFF